MPQARAEETRARILEAALLSFSQKGYDATGVAEICRHAQISKGAFYHHFPSKKDVFLASLQDWLKDLEGQLAVIRLEPGSVPEALTRMAALAGDEFEEIRASIPLLLEFWNQAGRDEEIWQVLIAPYRHFRDFLAEVVGRGVLEGSLENVQPQIAAQVLVSFAVGALVQAQMDPDSADWSVVAREGVRIFLQGLEG